jgi:hypothetical protein
MFPGEWKGWLLVAGGWVVALAVAAVVVNVVGRCAAQ